MVVKTTKRTLKGRGVNPLLTATARGVLESLIFAALLTGIAYLQGPGASLAAAPALLVGLRVLEGNFDRIMELDREEEQKSKSRARRKRVVVPPQGPTVTGEK